MAAILFLSHQRQSFTEQSLKNLCHIIQGDKNTKEGGVGDANPRGRVRREMFLSLLSPFCFSHHKINAEKIRFVIYNRHVNVTAFIYRTVLSGFLSTP